MTSQFLKKNNNNIIVIGFNNNSVNYIEKLGKLSKSRKSKSKKMFKSKKLVKSGKKLSQSRNSLNFDIIKAGSRFLIPNTKIIFNYSWLTFIKALILWYLDPKFYILIETNALGYGIDGLLN